MTIVALLFLAVSSSTLAQVLAGETRTVKVKKGEIISDFARRLGLAAEHLAWANGLETTIMLRPGQELRVPARVVPTKHPTDGIVLNLAERGFYLFDKGRYKGFVPVGIGDDAKASYQTPRGKFRVLSRVKNPDWIAPDSDWAKAMEKDRIEADSPDNPLGEYWFGFSAPGGGYGLHENTNPRYTGDTISHGCVRLYPEHAKYLYDNALLLPGDDVWIVNQPVRRARAPYGRRVMVAFPPVYGVTSPNSNVPANGIPQIKKRQSLSILNRGVEVLGEDARAIWYEDKILVPVRALENLGLKVKYDSDFDSITIAQGDKELTLLDDQPMLDLSVDYKKASPSPRFATVYTRDGKNYAAAREVLDYFDISYSWDKRRRRLEIR